jgi:hypothetical protein
VITSNRWVDDWTVTDDDLEYLTGILLEKEIPLGIQDFALALVERRIKAQERAIKEAFKNVRVYNPSQTYQAGQRILFPALNNQIGTVIGTRSGENRAYGDFTVIQVEFEQGELREFAAALQTAHKLSSQPENGSLPGAKLPTPEALLAEHREQIVAKLTEKLEQSSDLLAVSGKYFSRSLMLEVNEGHLNLAEAVLDMAEGGPMLTAGILRDIGGLGKSAPALQEFCLNDALNRDNRFDEVGPVDTVLWYLQRLEPPEVLNAPPLLVYNPLDYDPTLLTPSLHTLEAEIDDEWSQTEPIQSSPDEATILLIYPHRRLGTLPLNQRMQRVFPTARRTPRVFVTLVDGQDGEEFTGWVVRSHRYVYGLNALYRKHQVPVGAKMIAKRNSDPSKIVVTVKTYRKRTEFVRLIVPKDGQITFEEQKRSLSAEYDDQMILGADDLAAVDGLAQSHGRKSITQILRTLLTELGRTSPQGAVHAKTLYSAFNVVRRCPPGPIFAALNSGTDFEHVGNDYWKLRE